MPDQLENHSLESSDKLNKDCMLISTMGSVISNAKIELNVNHKIEKEQPETILSGETDDIGDCTINSDSGINPEHEAIKVNETDTVHKIEAVATLQKETELQKKILMRGVEKIEKEKFLFRLQSLLSRSQFYCKLLTTKIEKNKKEMEKMELKKQKDLEKKAAHSAGTSKGADIAKENDLMGPPPAKRHRGRKPLSTKEIESVATVTPKESLANVQESRQPKTFIGKMRDYQLDGMEWLLVLYDNGINGILADEMGLGKTIQVIALFAKLMGRNNVQGPYLVCAPLSTLGNWANEFARFTPHIKTLVYQGSKFHRRMLLNSIDKNTVVITSYEIVMRDHSQLSSRRTWQFIVIDEGHRLKNPDCKFVRDLKNYKATNRLLLTGTPLQNNLIELWSLLNFLMPDLFDDLKVFESWFDVSALQQEGANAEIIAQEQEKHIIATLHQILTPFLLRRTKAEVQLEIPPKKEVLIYARMSALEEKYYKASLNKSIEKLLGVEKGSGDASFEDINGVKKRRRSTQNISYKECLSESSDDCSEELNAIPPQNILAKPESPVKPHITSEIKLKMGSIMMHLKKIVTHPYLLEYPLTPGGDYLVDENLINNSGKLRVLDSLLKGLKKGGHRVLIFSQFTILLDILHDYCVYRGYKFVRLDGKMKMEERDENIKAFNEDQDIFIFLLSTRAGGLGLNLASADTVVIYDSDWNPQCDLQAQDRCHRYGQTKPVVVYRLVTGNTIDEKVVDRAHAKRKLEKMIMMKGRFSGQDSAKPKGERDLIVEHLKDLLKDMDKIEKVLPQDGEVFTQEQLAMLLDRSGKALEEDGCFKVIKTNMEEEEDV